MADQATDTACVDVQQRDSGAVSPKHVLAKDGGSPFFQEGHLNAGEQQHTGAGISMHKCASNRDDDLSGLSGDTEGSGCCISSDVRPAEILFQRLKRISEELAKMMAKMMSCSPLDMGPDGGHLPPNDMADSLKVRDLLAKAEQSGEDDDDAVQRFEDLVAQGRDVLDQINDTLNLLLAAEMNSAAAEDAVR